MHIENTTFDFRRWYKKCTINLLYDLYFLMVMSFLEECLFFIYVMIWYHTLRKKTMKYLLVRTGALDLSFLLSTGAVS